MSVTIETGAGVREARAYAPVSFVTSYLTARGRATAWSALTTAEQEAAIVAATDYIEKRFGERFEGYREFSFDAVQAEGSVAFTGVPVDTETLTVGDQVYTFVAALTGAADEVLIGASATATASNLFDALTAASSAVGSTFGTGTEQNRHVAPTLNGATVELEALADGSSGNFTELSGSPTNVTLAAFTGGLDGGSQPLSWPRLGVVDRSGRRVLGVPRAVKDAMAEYADRARSALLMPDPTVDARGGSIVRLKEVVGPIETDVQYSEGTHLGVTFKPYPAADRLLVHLLLPAGRAIR